MIANHSETKRVIFLIPVMAGSEYTTWGMMSEGEFGQGAIKVPFNCF
jgi:hypothetical protein